MDRSIALVLPHQLFERHPAIRKGRPVILLEDSLFFGDPHAAPGRFHKKKLVLHRASMRAYAERLRQDGHEVHYLETAAGETLPDVLTKHHHSSPFSRIVMVEPADYLAERRLRRFCSRSEVALEILTSPMFLTPSDWADAHFGSRKKPFMAAFYEAQRKRLGLLVDASGQPTGGRWSFDEENRRGMPKKGLVVPAETRAKRRPEVDEAEAYVSSRFPDAPGEPTGFSYPVTHEDASAWLDHFLQWRLTGFGPWEDALSERETVLFHSVLTPALNIGLITPEEVVTRTLAYAEESRVPIESLEGFLRQIVGWREFIFQMYRRHDVEMRKGNFFNHHRKLPKAFWTGRTGVAPLDLVIRRTLSSAWCHHIERLMVLGSFMLLCQVHPDEVYAWFMELFIDAYDWVMVPNVYGMSQFADGGIFATKPYISGSNYLRKMSDYSPGGWEPIWDGLFWNFIDTHRDYFRGQPRLSMMAATLAKMDPAKRAGHLTTAGGFLSGFESA